MPQCKDRIEISFSALYLKTSVDGWISTKTVRSRHVKTFEDSSDVARNEEVKL
jgi:hypothetical protein